MSANHDQSQKFKFVFDNLYQIYRQEKAQTGANSEAHANAPIERKPAVIPSPLTQSPLVTSKILKAEALPAGAVRPFEPMALLGKRLEQARPLAVSSAPVESLKANLKALNDIQSRLHFLLKEIESLSDPSDPEDKS